MPNDARGQDLELGDTIITFSDAGKVIIQGVIISLGKKRATVDVVWKSSNGEGRFVDKSKYVSKQYIDYARAIKIEIDKPDPTPSTNLEEQYVPFCCRTGTCSGKGH